MCFGVQCRELQLFLHEFACLYVFSFTTASFLGADEEIQDFSLPCSLFLFPSHYVYTITGSRSGPGRGAREGTAGQRPKAISGTISGYRTLDLRGARVSFVACLFPQRFGVRSGHSGHLLPPFVSHTDLRRSESPRNPDASMTGFRCVSTYGLNQRDGVFFFFCLFSRLSSHSSLFFPSISTDSPFWKK